MKKLLSVLFSGLLLFAFVGPAMADHPVWTGEPNYKFAVAGQIEIDGWYWKDAADNTNKYYNQETRIDFKGSWGDVTGRVRLEWDYDWEQGNQNKGNTTQNALDLAFINFKLPYTPVKVTAGLAPIAFGSSIYLDDSLYMLTAGVDIAKFGVTLGTAKMDETNVVDEDTDLYFLLFGTSAIPNHSLQALVMNQKITGNDDFAPIDIGLYFKGGVAMVKYWAEGWYQMGTDAMDNDRSGFALIAGAGAALGPVDLSGILAYGTGDDPDTADVENFQPLLPYCLPDLIVVDNLNGKSISDVTAVMVKAAVKPIAPLTAWVQAGYYMYNEKADGDPIGTELDLGVIYKINDYMTWKITAGYLLAGDALGDDAEDPIELNNEFMVTF